MVRRFAVGLAGVGLLAIAPTLAVGSLGAGTPLVPSNPTEAGAYGASVAVSGDGNTALSWDGDTALIGAPSDTEATDVLGNLTEVGAAWVFTRTGSSWKQQGATLTAPGGVVPEFGRAWPSPQTVAPH